MAVEKAAIDYSVLPAMTEARLKLDRALNELDTCFKTTNMATIKRRLKKAKNVKWPDFSPEPTK